MDDRLALVRNDRSALELPTSSPAPTIPAYNASQTQASGLVGLSGAALASLLYRVSDQLLISLSPQFSALSRHPEFGPWVQLAQGVDSRGDVANSEIALYRFSTALDVVYRPRADLRLSLATSCLAGPLPEDRVEVGARSTTSSARSASSAPTARSKRARPSETISRPSPPRARHRRR